MTLRSKENRARRTNEGRGAGIVAVVLVTSLLFLGAGLWATGQAHVEDAARAPPTGYYSTLGPDGIPVQPAHDPAPLQPSPKDVVTSESAVSGFNSGVSHV